MKDPILESDTYISTLIEGAILHVRLKDFKEMDLGEFIEIQKWSKNTIKNKHTFILAEFGNGSSITKELRDYAASPKGNTLSKGAAVLVRNLAQQLIGDYYLKFNKPVNPTKVFYKRENAIAWIKEQIELLNTK